jgi:hypothetical protein
VKAGSGAVLTVDWVVAPSVFACSGARVDVGVLVVVAALAVLCAVLCVGVEAAVTVVVCEPHAPSSAAHASASRAAAGARRVLRIIPSILFAARERNPRLDLTTA